jgi:hypothetical protein
MVLTYKDKCQTNSAQNRKLSDFAAVNIGIEAMFVN